MSNASCSCCVHSHGTSFLVSLWRGSVRDAKSGIKRWLWKCVLANVIPRKDRILFIFSGVSQLCIFFESALIPSALNTWPKKVSSSTEILHFPLFSFAPLSSILFSVAVVFCLSLFKDDHVILHVSDVWNITVFLIWCFGISRQLHSLQTKVLVTSNTTRV